MPYEIRRGLSGCSGYAVVKKGSSKALGCHPTREKAQAQLAALYANEGATAMKNPRTFTALAANEIGEDGLSWIEVMPTSEKFRNGPFYWTVDRADLDTLVTSIASNHAKLPIDYDHDGVRDGGSTEAAGWFTGEAKVVDAGESDPRGEVQDHASAWAQVKWTPTGKAKVEGGEFRFISPEWESENRDKKTGLLTKLKELTAATLTNRPAFKELAPVTASDLSNLNAIEEYAGEHDVEPQELMFALAVAAPDEELDKVLKTVWTRSYVDALPDTAFLLVADGKRHFPVKDEKGSVDQAHVRNAISRIPQSNVSADKTALQEKARRLLTKTTPASKEDEVDADVLKALGLDEDATSEDIMAAVVDLKEKVAITQSFDQGVLKTLARTTQAELEKDRELAMLHRTNAAKDLEREREDLLAKAVENGQILPVHKDSLRAVFNSNPAQARAIVDASPKRTFAEKGSGGPGPEEAPEMREYEDKRGNKIASLADPEWLDRKAQAILAEKGKSLKTATAAEYVEALNTAQALAESPR